MKKIVLVLVTVIVVLIISIIVFSTFAKRTHETPIHVDNDFLILSATSFNSGEVDGSSDYWEKSEYKLYTNGTVVFSNTYNISGKKDEKTYKIDNETMDRILEILDGDFNKYSEDYSSTDGVTWQLKYYNSNGDVIHEFNGYIYGKKILEELIDLL